MTLGKGRVYIWEEGEGFADFFHMFIYSYIMIFVISPAKIPSDNPRAVPGDLRLCVFSWQLP